MPKGAKRKKKSGKAKIQGEARQLTYKEEGQDYARILKALGACNFSLQCEDGKDRIGHVRGAMRKKVFVNPGDIVLISIREFQDGKCDIFHKFTETEAKKLKKDGVIPLLSKTESSHLADSGDSVENDDDDGGAFEFEDL